MSKILDATCAAGIVRSAGRVVVSADILSEGVGSSEGVLLMEEDTTTYVTSNATDIKNALDQLVSALGEIATALTSIDAKPVGGVASAPAPSATGNIVAINAAKSALTTLKGMLK